MTTPSMKPPRHFSLTKRVRALPNLIFIILLAVMAVGCDRHRFKYRLDMADSMAAVNSQKADSILASMADSIAMGSEEERMRWRLIKAKALVFGYHGFTTDTLIRPVVDFCERRGTDGKMLSETFYYAGKTYKSMNDYPRAMDYFQKALDAIPKEDTELRGRTYNQLGYIFKALWLEDKAIEMFKRADSCCVATQDSLSRVFTLRDIGTAYENKQMTDSAQSYLVKALHLAQQLHNTEMEAGISVQLAGHYVRSGDYRQAMSYLRKGLDYNDKQDRNAIFSVAARLYARIGRIDSALYFYRKLTVYGILPAQKMAHRELANYAIRQEDFRLAQRHLRLYETIVDSIFAVTSIQAIKQKSDFYDYSIRERENERLREESEHKTYVIVLLSLLATVVSLMVMFLVKYIRKERKELQYKLDKYNLLIERMEMQTTSVRPEDAAFENSPIGARLKQMVNNPQGKVWFSDEDWTQLNHAINTAYPDFNNKLADLCKMSLHDQRTCWLLKAKVPYQTICTLQHFTSSALTSSRSKLYMRAFKRKGAAKDWDAIIASL